MDFQRVQIEFEIKQVKLAAVMSGTPVKDGFEPGKYLGHGERLHHVVVGPCFETHQPIIQLISRGEHDDGGRRLGAHA
ncbi:hypothetical protein D3C81_2083850 [compost metagenome]